MGRPPLHASLTPSSSLDYQISRVFYQPRYYQDHLVIRVVYDASLQPYALARPNSQITNIIRGRHS